MKILRILLCLCLVSTFISCSDDDDGGNVDSDGINGTWTITEIDYSGETVTEFNGESVTSTFTAEGMNIDIRLTFNDNGTFTSEGSYDVTLTSSALGQTQTQVVNGEDFFGEGDYTVNGDTIIFNNDGAESESRIIELTDNRFVMDISTENVTDQGGFTVRASVDGTVVMVR